MLFSMCFVFIPDFLRRAAVPEILRLTVNSGPVKFTGWMFADQKSVWHFSVAFTR